jgi:DNA (cytosine-5)-methyltransferase 1
MRLVSLFSGCGGMDIGFMKAGFEIVWANDFDPDAQRVYRLNIGQIDPRDIRDVPADEVPDCDIITAGFPCQPFSNAGKRQGVLDDRGTLFQECLRIVESKQPRVVVFENVRGILSTRDLDGSKLIDNIEEQLARIGDGYSVSRKLLNASSYGVPQNRYRVFIIGVRKDLGVKFSFPPPIPKNGLEVGNVLDIPPHVPNQVDWKLSPQAARLITFIPEGGSWKDIPYEELPPRFRKIRDNIKKYRSPNFYRRFARNEINGTITAAAQPENCGIIHPVENRRYTIREIARIQSFDDDFLFFDETQRDVSSMYKLIGNAVPPKLAFVLAQAIRTQVWGEQPDE